MMFRVLLKRPVPPERQNDVKLEHGITLPPNATVDEVYFIDARSREAVIDIFEKAQQSGLEHLQGRTIKSIEELN